MFVVKLLAEGALYATVTVEEPNTAGDKVSITVEPLIDRAETVVGEPPTNTAKSVVAAVVAFSASLYVSVSVVPFAANTAELSTGAVVSTVELFVTAAELSEIESFPAAS